jgi:four helix bundle protein
MPRDHRKLEIFASADRLTIGVYQITQHLPDIERFGLQSQIRRAAVSIPTNIVEGCARTSLADYLRFLQIAYGSSREVLYLLDLARRLAFLREGDVAPLLKDYDRLAGGIFVAMTKLRELL